MAKIVAILYSSRGYLADQSMAPHLSDSDVVAILYSSRGYLADVEKHEFAFSFDRVAILYSSRGYLAVQQVEEQKSTETVAILYSSRGYLAAHNVKSPTLPSGCRNPLFIKGLSRCVTGFWPIGDRFMDSRNPLFIKGLSRWQAHGRAVRRVVGKSQSFIHQGVISLIDMPTNNFAVGVRSQSFIHQGVISLFIE